MKLSKILPVLLIIAVAIFAYYYVGSLDNKNKSIDNLTIKELEDSDYKFATFSAGWFWGLESGFEKYIGVINAVSGLTEVERDDPRYEVVSLESEAVRVYYDSKVLSYENILDIYWDFLNPSGGYITCYAKIFYETEEEKKLAEDFLKGKSGEVQILQATGFHVADDEHQDYYNTEPTIDYHATLGDGWNKEASIAMLTDLQRRVTQENYTEKPFDNEYWDNEEEGIYVDVVSGEPLFSSTHKYKSGSGWPSFYRPISDDFVQKYKDNTLFSTRTEIRSKIADSHLGHLFNDGPEPTGLRYCLNSAALRFVPKEDLEKEGLAEFLYLFDK